MTADDEEKALRAARAQAAVVRALTEAERGGFPGLSSTALHDQAVEESARLVGALEKLSKVRSEHPRALSDSSSSGSATAPKRPRVLLAEDDDETRTAIAAGLAASYDVTAASDGAEGLRAALERPFDVIVADVRMPEMDGVTMVEKIHDVHKDLLVPVIFLTAETDPERVAAGFSSGATSFLVKPLDLELLDAELHWLLGKTSKD